MPAGGVTAVRTTSGSTAAGTLPSAATSAFDELAAAYDADFTAGAIGSLLRAAVWRRLDARFTAGDRVLELNCGTGEDAVHLARRGIRVLATDASAAMLEVARRKAAAAGVAGAVELRRLAIEDLAALGGLAAPHQPAAPAAPDASAAMLEVARRKAAAAGVAGSVELRRLAIEDLASLGEPPFDGALSNFGGLNCVADLRAAAAGLAACLRPGAVAVLCVMGPLVPWEWAWYLGHGQPARAWRRLRPGGARWRGMTIRYPTVGGVRRAMAPAFRLRRAAAVGALLPPTYAEGWARRHPALLSRLARWERRVETWPPLPWLADHFLLELERR
jgi:ubiquinone/menaquinone biosynthesis C-methylase UbiE